MSYVEFLEGIARVAEKFSPLPLDEDPIDWTEIERINQTLGDKIANLIDLLTELN